MPLDKEASRCLVETLNETGTELHKRLSYFSLKNTNFDVEQFDSLSNFLKKAERLVSLDLSQNGQLSPKFTKIISFLPNLKNLRSLNLSGIDIDDEKLKRLLDQLLINKSIGMIDLTKNCITSLSIPLIKQFIFSIETIRDIKLEDNKLDKNQITQIKDFFTEKVEKQRSFTPTPILPSKRFEFHISETVGKRPTMEDTSLCCGCFRGKEDEDLFAVFDGKNFLNFFCFFFKNFPKFFFIFLFFKIE